MVGLITQYGLELVFANVLMQQMGLPIPALPTLIVAGALAADGEISALNMDLGYTHVRPLLGGLEAWIAAGYKVENRSVTSADGALTQEVSPA